MDGEDGWRARVIRRRRLLGGHSAQVYAVDFNGRPACLKVFAADDPCMTALNAAQQSHAARLAKRSRFVHFYDNGMHASSRSLCYLELGRPERASDHARESLDAFDPSFVRNVGITTLDLAIAHLRLGDVDEAARMTGEAVQHAVRNRSARLVEPSLWRIQRVGTPGCQSRLLPATSIRRRGERGYGQRERRQARGAY